MRDTTIFKNLTVSAGKILRGRCDDVCEPEFQIHNTPLLNIGKESQIESDVSTGADMRSGIFAIDIDDEWGGIDIDMKLSTVHREPLVHLIRANYLDWSNIPESEHNFEMEVKLTTDVPFHFAPRRLSAYDKNRAYEIISDLQSQGIVRPSDSPYASPIVLVKKKDGSTRMCVDYRELNKITMRDNYPLPLIEDCLEYLEGKRYFSVLLE